VIDVGDREGGGGLKPPGEAAPEEWTPCPTCGTHTKRKNLKHHLKKHEKKRAKMKEGEKKAGGPRPGRKPGPRNPALSDFSDEDLSSRVAAINRELKTLVPGFHSQRMAALSGEKRGLVGELRARKASGLSRQWGRWYGGPGKVRHYRGRSG
jgi:hypothetical protein